MRDLKHFLVVINDDTVIVYGTNMKSFLSKARKVDAIRDKIKSDSTMSRYFKKNNKILYLGADKKIYILQKVI
jgi:hypothetical protein